MFKRLYQWLRQVWNDLAWSWVPKAQREWVATHLRDRTNDAAKNLQQSFPQWVAYLRSRSWWPWRSSLRADKCRLALNYLQDKSESDNPNQKADEIESFKQEHNTLYQTHLCFGRPEKSRLGRLLFAKQPTESLSNDILKAAFNA